jgi:hypothetical protein
MSGDEHTEKLRGIQCKQIFQLTHVAYLKRRSFLEWGNGHRKGVRLGDKVACYDGWPTARY